MTGRELRDKLNEMSEEELELPVGDYDSSDEWAEFEDIVLESRGLTRRLVLW